MRFYIIDWSSWVSAIWMATSGQNYCTEKEEEVLKFLIDFRPIYKYEVEDFAVIYIFVRHLYYTHIWAFNTI